MNTDKHRDSYLTVSQQYGLNAACIPLRPFGYGTYHVGSSLSRPDYHDVDLRCILPDDEFDAMFGEKHTAGREDRLHFMNAVISAWLTPRTGLPIDFQFQRASEANEQFNGPRNAVGV